MTKNDSSAASAGAAAASSNGGISSNTENLGLGEKSNTNITIKTLLDAGAHFGHQTERWNPKMAQYIFTEKNGVHIINLDITARRWETARKFIVDKVSMGGTVLFVGTKSQGREIVQREANRCGAFYVTTRWLGGTLTNFQTIKNSVERMKKLEELLLEAEKPETKVRLNKKEKLTISRQLEKLEANLGGIRNMKKQPDLIFILDTSKEDLAVMEARRLRIPTVALVDTNTDPDTIDIAIPSNDDATRTIQLFCAAVADAIIEGAESYRARSPRAGGNDNSVQASDFEKRRGEKGAEVHVAPQLEAAAN